MKTAKSIQNKIESIRKTLSLGYKVKTKFARTEKLPLSPNQVQLMERKVDALLKQLPRYIWVSSHQGPRYGSFKTLTA